MKAKKIKFSSVVLGSGHKGYLYNKIKEKCDNRRHVSHSSHLPQLSETAFAPVNGIIINNNNMHHGKLVIRK